MKNKRFLALGTLFLAIPLLAGCKCNKDDPEDNGPLFKYEDISFVDEIGNRSNSETYNYNSLKVNKTEQDLREDFAFGVDASMVYVCLREGGVYYNEAGQEQNVFQILRKAGVNFVRFRLWNKPSNRLGMTYGGGENNFAVDLDMAKKAKAANLNVMIDFHYSDFWADPDYQNIPLDWGTLTPNEIPDKIEEYTKETLQAFADNGVVVDAIQVGNEINNGMCGYSIDWNNTEASFDQMAKMIQGGINGAKAVNKKCRTMVHLANGGNLAEFETFFTALDARKVNYDIIGASYYPHLSGSLSELQDNLNNVSQKTGKPVIVAETSWGYTDDFVVADENLKTKVLHNGDPVEANETVITANQYSSADEKVGNYLTSIQAQATCIRDICNVLSKVPENRGAGIFYWEPAWLTSAKKVRINDEDKIVSATPWATPAGQSYQYTGGDSARASQPYGESTWCNQGLFSYGGRMLPSLKTYSYVRSGFNSASEKSVSARDEAFSVTINLAAQETLPSTAKVVTDFDAIREASCTWDASAIEEVKTLGTHTDLHGVVDGKYNVICNAKCIQNYVVDPGFENQGTTDTVKLPWVIEYSTPANDKVIKLDRKKDVRSGKTDLNWFHSSKQFTFKVSQSITLAEAGTYSLTTYIMGVAPGVAKHNKLIVFFEHDGVKEEYDIIAHDGLKGWSAGYQTCAIENINIAANTTIKIGIEGDAEPKAWCHNDDWELVKVA